MKLIPSFHLRSYLPHGRSIGAVCGILSREKGPSFFLLTPFPSKTNVLQSFGNLELLVCLDSALSMGFFFFFLTTKLKEMSLEPSESCHLSITEQRGEKFQLPGVPVCIWKNVTWVGSLGGGQKILVAGWQT